MAVNLFGESGNFVSAKIWGCGKPALGQAASGACTSWSNLTASSLQASDCLVRLSPSASTSVLRSPLQGAPSCLSTFPGLLLYAGGIA